VSDLLPHQERGATLALDHLDQYGGHLMAWGMGAMKTATALEVVRRLGAERILVIGPKGALDPGIDFRGRPLNVWQRDAHFVYGGDAPSVLNLGAGSTAKKVEAMRTYREGIVTINWQSFWREPLLTELRKVKWDVVVGDEVHRAKSARGAASKAVARIPAPARLGLSGTPLQHDPLDAWAIFRFLAPQIFPRTLTQMRARYTRPALRSEWRDPDILITTGRGREILRWKLDHMDELAQKIGLITHVVRTEDVVDLPEFSDVEIAVDLEPAAMKVYRAIKEDMVAQVSQGVITAANAAVATLRLQQVTGGAVYEEDDMGMRTGRVIHVSDAKRQALADWLEDAVEPVVVFARFHTDLDAVHAAAKANGRTSYELSGRRTELAEWNASEAGVLAVQVQSGGEGIDLTKARLCVYFSLDYNWALWMQSRARVLRPGQTRNVQYVSFVCRGTVDEHVFKALTARGEVIGAILEHLRDP